MRPHIRDDGAYIAIGMLIGGQVAQPLGKELLRVKIHAGGAGKDLRIAHPAQALVALGTIGGNVHKIALLAPDDVGEQLVQHGLGGSDMAGAPHVAVHGNAGEAVQRDLPGEAVHPDVAESVIGEPGLVGLAAIAANVAILAPGAAVILGVEIALLIHHLGEGDVHHIPCVGVHADLQEAGQLLAEVDDGLPIGGHEHAGGMDALLLADGRALMGDERVRGAVAEDSLGLFRRDEGGIHHLAVVQLGEADDERWVKSIATSRFV